MTDGIVQTNWKFCGSRSFVYIFRYWINVKPGYTILSSRRSHSFQFARTNLFFCSRFLINRWFSPHKFTIFKYEFHKIFSSFYRLPPPPLFISYRTFVMRFTLWRRYSIAFSEWNSSAPFVLISRFSTVGFFNLIYYKFQFLFLYMFNSMFVLL